MVLAPAALPAAIQPFVNVLVLLLLLGLRSFRVTITTGPAVAMHSRWTLSRNTEGVLNVSHIPCRAVDCRCLQAAELVQTC